MLFAVVDLGPSTPFIGVAITGLVVASAVAGVAVLALPPTRDGQPPWRTRKAPVWFLVWGVTFLLWGSSSGHGGPIPGGGTTGYTHGGILRYVTVTSYQPGVGAEWSHEFSLRVWPLVGTVALSAAVIAGAVAGLRWRKTAEPAGAPARGDDG